MDYNSRIHEVSEEPDPNYGKLSQSAIEALNTFQNQAGRHAEIGLISQSERIVGMLEQFSPGALHGAAFDAAALQHVADYIHQGKAPVRRKAAAAALHGYFAMDSIDGRIVRTSDHSHLKRSIGYAGVLLGDIVKIDEAANSFRQRIEDYDPESFEILQNNDEIPKSMWLNLRIGADVPELARVRKITNIESRLARAAYTIDRMMHGDDDDARLFEDIARIRSHHSPGLDALGLHAFDMVAQSNADKIALLKSGNEAALERSIKTLAQAKRFDTNEIMQEVFGIMPTKHIFDTKGQAFYDEKIHFSTTEISELTRGDIDGEVNARFKTVGKYAMKCLRNPSYADNKNNAGPADVFGMLATLPDDKQLVEFFANTVRQVSQNDKLELTTAASKSKPLYIQGASSYVKRVLEAMPDGFLDYIQTSVLPGNETDVYQVVKFTCQMKQGEITLPIEVQMQTEADRENARFGAASHTHYNARKYGNGEIKSGVYDLSATIPGSPDDLAIIHRDRDKIDSGGQAVKATSIPNGMAFERRLRKARRL